MNRYTIGELAELSGISRETIRYYERRGLLSHSKRTEGGYRIYEEEDVKRLTFVLQAKSLGFSLTEVKELLEIRKDPKQSSEAIKERVEVKISEVEDKILDLQRLRSTLKSLNQKCDGSQSASQCPIFRELECPLLTEQNNTNSSD